MKKYLLSILVVALIFASADLFGHKMVLEVPIIKNGETETITLDDGTEITVDLSSDDCEQENDAIDTPYDDDIDAGWEGEDGDANILTAGLRFQNISIPKGAVITEAYIQVWSHEDKRAEDVANLTIWGEASDNAETYNEIDLITDRPRTNSSVRWVVAEEWKIWEMYQTPDISSIVQEIINRDGWMSGNSLALMITGEDQGPSDVENAREWEAFENISDPEDGGDGQNHPERVPKLVIHYEVEQPANMLVIPIVKNGETETITLDDGTEITVDLSSDDCEQENDAIDTPYDDDIDAGWEGEDGDANILTAGLRFQNVQLPKGATVTNAYINVWSHEDKRAEDVANLTIWGEASDNAATYNEVDLITDRARTNQTVRWVVAEEWGIWEKYSTPNISAIVQEIVDRDGWQTGNSIAIVISGEDQGPSDVENAREWEAFENISDPEDGGDGQNHPERVPQLVIEYEMNEPEVMTLDIPIVKNGETETITLDDGTEITVDLSSDDCEQENDAIDTPYDDDIDAGWEGEDGDANILTAGLRFQNIQLPKGAQVVSAYIHVWSHEDKRAEDVANLTIWGEASDNAETYNEVDLITDRPRTNTSIRWVVAEEWKIWEKYSTPDIKDIIQEIVDRPGWNTGNSIALMITGEDQGPSDVENAREWEAFENISDPEDGGDGQNHPDRVPRLIINYKSGSSVKEVVFHHNSLKVYPNPVSEGIFHVELENTLPAEIYIYTQNGELVRTLKTGIINNVEINADGLANGVYIIQAIQGGKAYTQKLIID